MKKILPLFSLFLLLSTLHAQTERAVVAFEDHEMNMALIRKAGEKPSYRATMLSEVPLANAKPFLAYSITWESEIWDENSKFSILFFDGENQSETLLVEPDPHAETKGPKRVSQLYFTKKDQVQFRLNYSGESELKNVEVHFFSPGNSGHQSAVNSPQSGTSRFACPCPQPDYLDRTGWCPDGTCPPDATPVTTNVTHLIIHHSAGSNFSSDWAATVRAIWDFHVNVNGWDDIGYNWLVDPNGVLYEGRGDNRLGAHFCGTNGGTMGVCVMGDFTDVTPTANAYGILEELLSWKICDINADPLGTSLHPGSGQELHHISGHRDGCSTACPGDSFYPTLPDVRTNVEARILNDCNSVTIATPTDLDANALSFTSVELTWADNADNEDGYVVERSKSFNTNFEEIATLPANTVGYDDLNVQSSTGYFYRVKAVLGALSSLYSNEAYAATAFSAVDNEKLGGGSVKIFPNPTTSTATVNIDNQWIGTISATLHDALGKQVSEEIIIEKNTGEVKFELPLGELPAGVFWVKISQEGKDAGMFKLMKN